MEAESTKGATTAGAAGPSPKENQGAAASSPNSAQTDKSVTGKGAPLGTLIERLEISQQALANYQKAGGKVLIQYRKDEKILVIGLPEIQPCQNPKCGHWFSGNVRCPYCGRVIDTEQKPEGAK